MSDVHRDLWVPRVGETWVPVLPWPEDRPPDGFYVESLRDSSHRVVSDEGVVVRPCAYRWRAVLLAWEFRFGDVLAPWWGLPGDPLANVLRPRRFGCEPMKIDAVGAECVWALQSGRLLTVHLGDMRRGFVRVGAAS